LETGFFCEFSLLGFRGAQKKPKQKNQPLNNLPKNPNPELKLLTSPWLAVFSEIVHVAIILAKSLL